MNGASHEATLLFFPCLHPALVEGDVSGVRFLDPGLADPKDRRYLRPAGLPLGGDDLAGFLREFARLRQEVKNPKDLALLAGSSDGHFFSDTSFAVREELEDHLHPERVAARRATSVQLALCLAYMIEESLLELAGTGELDARFSRAMIESLGLEPDVDTDEEAAALVAALSGAGERLTTASFTEEFRPPWRQMVSPFWAMAPEGAGIFVADPDIVAAWLDAGVSLTAPESGEMAVWFPDGAPTGTLLVGREAGWRLLGKTRPQPQAPWLDRLRPVVVVQP
jgi:hypothetical protein